MRSVCPVKCTGGPSGPPFFSLVETILILRPLCPQMGNLTPLMIATPTHLPPVLHRRRKGLVDLTVVVVGPTGGKGFGHKCQVSRSADDLTLILPHDKFGYNLFFCFIFFAILLYSAFYANRDMSLVEWMEVMGIFAFYGSTPSTLPLPCPGREATSSTLSLNVGI